MTGEDLNFTVSRESSKEINASRQTSDSIQVDAEAAGSVNLEMSYSEYDPFLEALLAGSFDTSFAGSTNTKQLTVSFVAGGTNTITDDGSDGFAGLVVGQWVSFVGDSSAANDGIYLITAMTDDELTVDASTPVSTTAASVLVNVSSSRLEIGTVAQRSFSVEKQFTDVDQYFIMKGMCPSKLDLSFSTGAIVTGSVGFLGTGSARADATALPGTLAAAESFGLINSVTGVGAVAGAGGIFLRDGSTNLLADTFVQSMAISVDAALRTQKSIGVLGAAGVATGTFKITGSLEVYLADGELYDKALDDTTVSITFPIHDSSGNGYAFTFSDIKLGVPTVAAGSMDSDIVLSFEFDALAPDTSTDSCIKIDRFGEAI